MIDLAGIQTAYYLVAATGVLVAAVFYVLSLKSTIDNRRAQLLMEFNRIISSKEWVTDLHIVLNYEWSDFDEFWSKYGHSNPVDHSRWISIGNSMSAMLSLLNRSLVDEEMLREYLSSVSMGSFWEKFGPAVKEMRVRMNNPHFFSNIEFYYDKWLNQGKILAEGHTL